MLIKIGYPNQISFTVVIFFVLTWWIINEFEKEWQTDNEVREDVVRLIYFNLGKHEFFSAFHC